MLDRLRAADRFAELVAILGIGDCHVDAALAQADQLRGGQQGAARCGIAPAAGHFCRRIGCPVDAEQRAERIEARLAGQRHISALDDMQIVAIGQDQRIGDIGIGHKRIDRMTDRNDRAIDRARQPALVVFQRDEQRDCNSRSVQQRLGQRDITGGLCNADQIDHVHSHTAGTFRGDKARQAHLADRLPARSVDCAFIGQSLAQIGRGAGFHQHFTRRLGDGDLVFGKGKLHGYALGRPSMRSAMILR